MASVCPKTKFAVGGHGEGGVVAVKAIQAREDILANVIAVTILGGPACPEAVADRCRSYCNAGDTFCEQSHPVDDCQSEERRWVSEGLLTERADIENPLATLVAPDCGGSEPPEKGHVVGNGIDPHTGYHEDGFYPSRTGTAQYSTSTAPTHETIPVPTTGAEPTTHAQGHGHGHSIKAAAAGIHGVGESLRGNANAAVDRAMEDPEGVRKNEAIAREGEREVQTGEFSRGTKKREMGHEYDMI
ncbi:hypothetical protein FQN55_008243 [Onygenales sp. PD_40]|nr:hypothetical protein FQN55_008243 [Onygenales sp. PD_40]